MPNPLRGEAAFQAGASSFTLVFDINVFCELEDETGLDLPGLIEQIQDKPSFKLLRSIFCAGLQTHHPGTSIKETGEIMSDAGLIEMKRALAKAIQAAMPGKGEIDVPGDSAAGESAGGKARSPVAGTGSPSSPSGRRRATTRKPSGVKPPAR